MARDLIGPLLDVALGIAADSLSPRPSRQVISPGPPAWDDCCAGQVWTRLVGLVPHTGTTNQRVQRSSFHPCGVLAWVATIGIGVIRCVSTVQDSGSAPPATAVTADARLLIADMNDLAEAIQCGLATVEGVEGLGIERWAPLGPLGGCAGGEWIVNVIVDNCTCSQ